MSTDQPRVGDTITTAERLDAILEYATSRGEYVIVTEGWRPWILTDNEHGDVWAHSWLEEGEDSHVKPIETLRLPLTVLYVPGEQPSPSVEDARAEVVCLCGSTRFRAEFTEANRRLTMAGAVVVAPGVFQHDGDPLTDEEKERLDALHFRKIDLADRVVVVAPGGYIGSSTSREVTYAKSTGKPVEVWDDWPERAGSRAVPSDQAVSSTGHRWPCVGFTERCTCPPSDHTATTEDAAVEAARQMIGRWTRDAAQVLDDVIQHLRRIWSPAVDYADEREVIDAAEVLLGQALPQLATARPDTTTEPTDAQVAVAAVAFENRWNEGVREAAAELAADVDPDAFIQQAMRDALRAAWTEAGR